MMNIKLPALKCLSVVLVFTALALLFTPATTLAAAPPEFDRRFGELEKALETRSMSFEAIASGFVRLEYDVRDYCSYTANYEYAKKNRQRLLDRVGAGAAKTLTLWGESLETEATEIMSWLWGALLEGEPPHELLASYEELAPKLDAYGDFLYSVRHEITASQAFLKEQEELKQALQRAVQDKKTVGELDDAARLMLAVDGATSLKDVQNLREVIKICLIKTNSSPALPPEVDEAYRKMNSQAQKKLFGICMDASRAQCRERLSSLDKKYRDHIVITVLTADEYDVSLLEFACAADKQGMFKKFRAGGIFSSEIALELEMGTIYFREARVNLDTMQEVSLSFNGPRVKNILLATEFEGVDGSKGVFRKPYDELAIIMSTWGGIPLVPQCSQ